MKVIFLDIDGVLNSSGSCLVKIGLEFSPERQAAFDALLKDIWVASFPTFLEYTLKCTDPIAVALVNRLVEKADAKIVLSSSHRKHFHELAQYGSEKHLELLAQLLRAMGINGDALVDVTPMLYIERGAEVRRWLDDHPEVERWVTLDDGADFKPEHDVNLVKTDARLGFTGTEYFAAAHQLGLVESQLIY